MASEQRALSGRYLYTRVVRRRLSIFNENGPNARSKPKRQGVGERKVKSIHPIYSRFTFHIFAFATVLTVQSYRLHNFQNAFHFSARGPGQRHSPAAASAALSSAHTFTELTTHGLQGARGRAAVLECLHHTAYKGEGFESRRRGKIIRITITLKICKGY